MASAVYLVAIRKKAVSFLGVAWFSCLRGWSAFGFGKRASVMYLVAIWGKGFWWPQGCLFEFLGFAFTACVRGACVAACSIPSASLLVVCRVFAEVSQLP